MHGTAYEIRRPHYLARIRGDIGAAMRHEVDLAEPVPQNLLELLKELETGVRRDTTRERLLADVDACVAEVVRAGPWETHASKGSAIVRCKFDGV